MNTVNQKVGAIFKASTVLIGMITEGLKMAEGKCSGQTRPSYLSVPENKVFKTQ